MILGRHTYASGLRALTRASRPQLLVEVKSRPSSSLSAVHRGLRQSERSAREDYSSRPRSAGTRGSDARSSVTGRPRPGVNDDHSKVDFKIRKGKKDIAVPEKPKRKTRSARFNDPTDSFGKKSLVFKLKSGQLRDELAALQTKDVKATRTEDDFWNTNKPQSRPKSRSTPARRETPRLLAPSAPWGGRGRTNSRVQHKPPPTGDYKPFRRPASEGAPRRAVDDRKHQPLTFGAARGWNPASEEASRRTMDDRKHQGHDFEEARGRRPASEEDQMWDTNDGDSRGARSRMSASEGPPRREPDDGNYQARGFGEVRDRDSGAPRSQDANGRGTRDYDGFRSRPGTTSTMIKYTTAASQFLYGKFVVEEALRASRRKLYHLYIYGGANRENVGRDKAIEKLAAKRGVKVTTLGEQDQKMMAKMSQGRPHNGYILEASPIPQPPVTALGPLTSEKSDAEDKNSFGVVLGYQSAEDLAVNGKDEVVPARSGPHKPLVLLLDHVLDPGNLGAILRTASFLGVSAVAISTKSSATLTPVALKASAGASETIPLFAVDSPVEFLERSKEAGWKVYAAVAEHSSSHHREHADIYSVEDDDPLASDPCILVVGSEGEGLPRMLKAKANVEVNIPNQSGWSLTVDSLNVSVAAAMLCSAFMRGPNKLAMPPRRDGPAKSEELGIW